MAQAYMSSRKAVVPVYWTSRWLVHVDCDRARCRRCRRRAAFWAGLSIDLVGWGLQRQTPKGKEAWLLSMLGRRKERVLALEKEKGKCACQWVEPENGQSWALWEWGQQGECSREEPKTVSIMQGGIWLGNWKTPCMTLHDFCLPLSRQREHSAQPA